MRILHVTDTYLPRLGGIELHVSDLAARQCAAGNDVLVVTGERLEGGALLGTTAAAQVPVARIRASLAGAGIGVPLGPVVANFAPDILHAHLTVGSPFTWAVLRNTAGIPTIATMHSLLPRFTHLVRAGIRAAGIPEGRIDFTAVSEVAAARLRPALRPATRVRVLHNGVDPTRWSVVPTHHETFNILAVGRLAARKRPLVLVQALAELSDAAPDLPWTATIVGDGNQRRRVVESVRAYGLAGRVRLPGALQRPTIRDLLASADAFVAPATLESFGIAALEARCAGVPVIGMAASGLSEFIRHEQDGLLAGRDRDISIALQRLALEPCLAQSIRQHCAVPPSDLSWESVIAQHDLAYESTIYRALGRGRPAEELALSGGIR